MQTMVTTIVRKVFISIIIPNCNFRINYFRMRGLVLNKNVLKKTTTVGLFFSLVQVCPQERVIDHGARGLCNGSLCDCS